MSACGKCNENIISEDQLVCIICKMTVHYFCLGMKTEIFSKKKNSFRCYSCNTVESLGNGLNLDMTGPRASRSATVAASKDLSKAVVTAAAYANANDGADTRASAASPATATPSDEPSAFSLQPSPAAGSRPPAPRRPLTTHSSS